MNERIEQLAGAFLIGALLPVLVVIWFGLMNEGFSSLTFLFYPGPETWLQLALLAVFAVLVARSLSALRDRAFQVSRSASVPTLIVSLVGLALASTVLYVVGIGEAPWRKFYTYVVAPRAVSAWLLGAVLLLMSVMPRTREHAA
jgi:hypothetical protein